MLKTCVTCRVGKPTSAFARDKSRSDGLNPRCRDCRRAYYQQGRERFLAQQATYADEGRAQRAKQWREDNRARYNELARASCQRRRARRKGNQVFTVSERDWRRLVARYGGLCAYCQERPWKHRDHVVPIHRGGAHSIGNLLPACAQCNRLKHTKTITEWRQVAVAC